MCIVCCLQSPAETRGFVIPGVIPVSKCVFRVAPWKRHPILRPPRNMSAPVKVAVVGASGYSGAELLRLLLRHPNVELVAVTSRSLAGKALSKEFPRFRGVGVADSLTFTAPDANALKAAGAEIAFLAVPHGVASEYAKPLLELGLKVIDLSADFRLRSAALYEEFYGHAHPAPELLDEAVYALP